MTMTTMMRIVTAAVARAMPATAPEDTPGAQKGQKWGKKLHIARINTDLGEEGANDEKKRCLHVQL